ncbi:MAG: hypothetical protein AAF429_03585 [Pseudomonadota bacterium]
MLVVFSSEPPEKVDEIQREVIKAVVAASNEIAGSGNADNLQVSKIPAPRWASLSKRNSALKIESNAPIHGGALESTIDAVVGASRALVNIETATVRATLTKPE